MNRANTPYDSEHAPKASCDCCGKPAELTFSTSWATGDTWACQECYWPAAHYDENFKPRKENVVTQRKHGTKPNLNAQKRRSAQARALESKQYWPRRIPDKRRLAAAQEASEALQKGDFPKADAIRRANDLPCGNADKPGWTPAPQPTMYGRDKCLNWQGITLAATNGTQLGAILRAAYGVAHEDGIAWFGSHATVTSDGFLIADFTTADGEFHMGAFIGSLDDLNDNRRKLAAHCELTDADAIALESALASWYDGYR